MNTAPDMVLYDTANRLASTEARFNALAQVAGREMAKYVKPAVVVPLTIGFSAIGAAAEAKWGGRGAIASTVLAAVAYGVGFMSGDNADLRWGAYSVAMGLGTAAAAVATHEKVCNMIGTCSAPQSVLVNTPVPQS